MNTKKTVAIIISATILCLLVIFLVSEYYGEEMSVPAIANYENTDNDDLAAEIFGTTVDLTPDFPLDLNVCTVNELEFIPNIGRITASNIVEYAEENGFFTLEQLLEIDGIGEKTYEVLCDYVYIDSEITEKYLSTMTEATYLETTTALIVNFPLDLNTATEKELDEIPEIGEVTAKKIVEYASSVGFSSVDELLNIDGIGEITLDKIREYVFVSQ